MTRIRLDLSDYDFDIIYKQGSLNTNADALSRIKLDSDILKTMIPLEVDQTAKRTLVVTRQTAAQLINKNMGLKDNAPNEHEKTDHLHIWECISLNDIKNMKKLIIKVDYKNFKKVKIFIDKNNVHVESMDESAKPVSTLKNIQSSNNKHSENSLKLELILKPLISYMKQENINELALNKKDDIFVHCTTEEFKKAFEKIMKNEKRVKIKILLYNSPKIITSRAEQCKLIEDTHNKSHMGVRKTLLKLKQNYNWKNMNTMIKKYISKCDTCLRNKQTKHIKEPMTLTDTPTNSFETIEIDIVGPLRISNGFRYILTMQCVLTKFIIAHPIPTKDAVTTARTLVEQLILRYGIFKTLKSDRGTEFTNELLKNICLLLNIDQKFSSPYHHETIGALERNHRVLNEFMLTSTNNNEWDTWLPYFAFAYNTSPHVDTGYSPFELVFGKLPSKPDEENLNKQSYNYDDYNIELQTRLKFALDKANFLLNLAKKKRIEKPMVTNQFTLNVGDLVLLKVANKKKYESPYKGPYEIISRDGENSYIRINNKTIKFHNNLLKPYKL